MSYELPHAPNAEAAVLASLIENPTYFWPLATEGGIEADFFHAPGHRLLWEMIAKRLRSGEIADSVYLRDAILTLRDSVLNLHLLSTVLLTEIAEGSWDSHLRVLRDRLAKRLAIAAGELAKEHDITGDSALAALRMASERANSILAGQSAIMDARAAVRAFTRAIQDRIDAGEIPGMTTGIGQLDMITGGIRRGEFWVIAGKTSHGKSALMLQIAGNSIRAGKRVLIFTLEMTVEEVIGRMIACEGGIDIGSILNPREGDKLERSTIRRLAEEFSETNMMICDRGTMTVDEISGHALRIAETKGVDLVVIDYIQLIHSIPVKGQNRQQEVAGISRACKQLAKRLGCPVITASQLNEAGNTRESRAIEQDADALFQIVNDEGFKGLLAWKLRNGKRNEEIRANFDGEKQKFIFN